MSRKSIGRSQWMRWTQFRSPGGSTIPWRWYNNYVSNWSFISQYMGQLQWLSGPHWRSNPVHTLHIWTLATLHFYLIPSPPHSFSTSRSLHLHLVPSPPHSFSTSRSLHLTPSPPHALASSPPHTLSTSLFHSLSSPHSLSTSHSHPLSTSHTHTLSTSHPHTLPQRCRGWLRHTWLLERHFLACFHFPLFPEYLLQRERPGGGED